jgi:chaperone BCS1
MCHNHQLDAMQRGTIVRFAPDNYHMRPGGWDNWVTVVKAVRKLDTIDLDDQLKADIVTDAEECASCPLTPVLYFLILKN